MSDKYKITNHQAMHFVTFTVIDWVDLFTRKEFCHLFINSLNYCVDNKGPRVHAWCIMPSHTHLIISAKQDILLTDIIRDLKKFFSKQVIKEMNVIHESRKVWLLRKFEYAGKRDNKIKRYKVWKDGNHAVYLESNKFINQKLNYLHNNPVASDIVREPHHYVFSSAGDYSSIKGLVKLEMIE